MVLLPAARFIEAARDLYGQSSRLPRPVSNRRCQRVPPPCPTPNPHVPAEAYALYCFWVLLVLWSGGQREVTGMLQLQDTACYACPLFVRCRLGMPLGRHSGAKGRVWYWRWAVTQAMVVKPAVSLVIAMLKTLGPQGEAYERLRVIGLLSTAVAMHTVLDTYGELAPSPGSAGPGLEADCPSFPYHLPPITLRRPQSGSMTASRASTASASS